jgi:hypothetical protein
MNHLTSLAIALPLAGAVGLQAADRFDPSQQPLGALSAIELSTTDLSAGAEAYRPWFENGAWQGDVVEYVVSSNGLLSTTVDLTGTSPENTGAKTNWSAHVAFAEAVAANADYWNLTRKIITYNGTSQVAFRWNNLSAAQKLALDSTAAENGDTSSIILDYVRGDSSNEYPIGSLRSRISILGDIVHSNPFYVGPPNASTTDAGYASFAETYATRDDRVYVGSNAGVLHVFDADDGREVYAYVPSMVVGKLDKLAGRPYSHLYAVDGQITVKDANAGGWKTVLVGGLGAGGRGWFALDVTNPDLANEASASGANNKVMWEINAASDNDLGYSYGRAVITKLNDDKWYAVMGNGYNSVNGVAMLYIVDLNTGSIRRLTTASGSTGSPNGLSAPALLDTDRDGKSDVAYAGDIDGNLWKFDLTATNAGGWGVAYSGEPLHPGVSSQPIIQAPDISVHPDSGYLVYISTGRLLTEGDLSDTSTQAMYGIWDLRGAAPPTAASQNLHVQTLSGELNYTATDISEVVQTFTPDPGEIDWSSKDGWKVELPAGFRSITPIIVRASRVKATLHNPATRENYIFEPYFLDGGAPESPVFDLNQSESLTEQDNVDGNGDGDLVDTDDIVAMLKLDEGYMSETTIGRVSRGVDAQLINYLVPPIAEPCTGDCVAGFQGGHIDVDTDYWDNEDGGTGGATEWHTHEYDKLTGRVYVDYRDHGAVTGHVEIDDPAWIPQDDMYVVVVANADMSPGSTLVLDGREYNVVEYQRMIQRKLREWEGGSSPLADDNGNRLIFSGNALASSGGTVRHDFDDTALLAGGVHPTRVACVNADDAVTNGRYRNGSLVTQFINLDVFTACTGVGCSLDKVTVQDPTDLPEEVLLGDATRVPMGEDLNEDGVIEAADYEIYGGIRGISGGRGDTDVLFESTIFWHYPGVACYGDPGWEEDVQTQIEDLVITQEEFDDILAAQGITDLDEEISQTQACIEAAGADAKTCKKYYAELLELKELEERVFDPDVSSDTGLDSSGETPYSMGGAADDAMHFLSGENYQTGRRTWTDIFDD